MACGGREEKRILRRAIFAARNPIKRSDCKQRNERRNAVWRSANFLNISLCIFLSIRRPACAAAKFRLYAFPRSAYAFRRCRKSLCSRLRCPWGEADPADRDCTGCRGRNRCTGGCNRCRAAARGNPARAGNPVFRANRGTTKASRENRAYPAILSACGKAAPD